VKGERQGFIRRKQVCSGAKINWEKGGGHEEKKSTKRSEAASGTLCGNSRGLRAQGPWGKNATEKAEARQGGSSGAKKGE